MAKIIGTPTVKLSVTLQLTEEEALAFDAIVGYGVDSFLEAFYEKMGKAYLQPHEGGLRSLFESVRSNIPGLLSRSREARKLFHQESQS